MEIDKTITGSHDWHRTGLLIQKAADLNMDLNSYVRLALNENSGDVYFWLEDYPFSLHIAMHSETVKACWTDSNTGEEVYTSVLRKSLSELVDWTDNLQKQSEINNA